MQEKDFKKEYTHSKDTDGIEDGKIPMSVGNYSITCVLLAILKEMKKND